MNWHGQINRTIWEIDHLISEKPNNHRLRRELLRTQFLQRYEYDRSHHIARDDRSFLFMQEEKAPAALLLHGAHGTPAEMRDLGNFLYSKGFTVFCPRLSRYDAKNRLVTWESWVTAAETALTSTLKYSDRTLVVGLSLGGTVSMLLERMYPVKGLVLLAPALYPRPGLKRSMLALLRYVAPPLFYRLAGWNGEAVKAMDHIRKTADNIKTPALTMQAKDDGVLSSRGIKLLKRYATHASSETILLEKGSHALTRGPAKEDVFRRMFEFAQGLRLIDGQTPSGRAPGRVGDHPAPRGDERGDERGGRPRGRRGSRGGRGRRGGANRQGSGSQPREGEARQPSASNRPAGRPTGSSDRDNRRPEQRPDSSNVTDNRRPEQRPDSSNVTDNRRPEQRPDSRRDRDDPRWSRGDRSNERGERRPRRPRRPENHDQPTPGRDPRPQEPQERGEVQPPKRDERSATDNTQTGPASKPSDD